MTLDHSSRFEGLERERVNELLERDTVLEALAHRDGKAGQHAPQRRAFLSQVDEQLAERAVLVFAGAQVDLVAADDRLLGVAGAAVWQGDADQARRDPALIETYLGLARS